MDVLLQPFLNYGSGFQIRRVLWFRPTPMVGKHPHIKRSFPFSPSDQNMTMLSRLFIPRRCLAGAAPSQLFGTSAGPWNEMKKTIDSNDSAVSHEALKASIDQQIAKLNISLEALHISSKIDSLKAIKALIDKANKIAENASKKGSSRYLTFEDFVGHTKLTNHQKSHDQWKKEFDAVMTFVEEVTVGIEGATGEKPHVEYKYDKTEPRIYVVIAKNADTKWKNDGTERLVEYSDQVTLVLVK